MRNVTMFLATVLALFAVTIVQAGVIGEHIGSNNPLTEGLTAAGDFSGSPDAGPPASWHFLGGVTSSGWGEYYIDITSADLADPTGWTFTYETKLVSGIAPMYAYAGVWDGTNRIMFSFLDGAYPEGAWPAGAYYASGSTSWAKVGDVDPTDGFHTYQIVFDPNDAGTADDTVTFYVDGVDETGALLRSQLNGDGGGPYCLFGQGTGGNTSEQYISWARLETGQHPVPEPSTVVVLLIGTLCAVGIYRTQR